MKQTIDGEQYQGSHIFNFISKRTGLPIDQFNFLLAEVLALLFAICFRRYLPPKPSNVIKRHLVASFIGIVLCQFCFGSQIWHLILQSCSSYLILCFISPKHSYKVIFVFCMTYLSAIHIHRVIYDYGDKTLDISGQLMVNTQKLTALAFSFFDGYRSKERAKRRRSDDDKDCPGLSEDQEKQKILEIPHPIELLSYMFYFHAICGAGPLCFYRDYLDYIEGRNLLVIPTNSEQKNENHEVAKNNYSKRFQPSTFWPVVTKLFQCLFWCYICLNYLPYYCIKNNISDEIVNSPIYKRLLFLFFSIFCHCSKYYFAFLLSEAVNNAGGLGLNGVDEKGQPKWNLLTNVEPFRIETATSTKVITNYWNMQTSLWLRRVCYNRLRKGRTISVFVLSAIWHGFYPGYYVCFGFAILLTYIGRGFRRHVRPHFQKNEFTKAIYAILTWFGTRFVFCFGIGSFLLADFRRIWYLYKTWYFIVPISLITLTLILFIYGERTKSPKNKESQQETDMKKSS